MSKSSKRAPSSSALVPSAVGARPEGAIAAYAANSAECLAMAAELVVAQW